MVSVSMQCRSHALLFSCALTPTCCLWRAAACNGTGSRGFVPPHRQEACTHFCGMLAEVSMGTCLRRGRVRHALGGHLAGALPALRGLGARLRAARAGALLQGLWRGGNAAAQARGGRVGLPEGRARRHRQRAQGALQHPGMIVGGGSMSLARGSLVPASHQHAACMSMLLTG